MVTVVVEQKLESLRRCLARVQDKCPDSLEQLESDADTQDILVLNLTRAVQLCVDIATHLIGRLDGPAPQTMGESFDELARVGVLDAEIAGSLKKAVGFRNVAVHNYDAIDWAIVMSICRDKVPDFRRFAEQIVRVEDES
ncbi:MAG: DUF86 domain-containing protein [Chromatiales bacterium]|nr:DUF86 domain-containing protein [Chromatiales bacterium]